MASDDSMTIHSSMHDDEDDAGDANDEDDHHNHPSHLSRLSMCTSSRNPSMYEDDDDDDGNGGGDADMRMYISSLSIEGSDADADDEELSDEKECKEVSEMSSDSDKDPGCFSLPATPPRRRIRRGYLSLPIRVKEYVSENEAQKGVVGQKTRRNSRRTVVRERWLERAWEKKKNKAVEEDRVMMEHNNMSGESECLVITRPKGGRRSLCMDLEEVKACRDLGFELEHERMLEIPSRFSMSGSTIDTSSGGNSPIANWRISSPGDDPRDVKARLKVWAQAVALASASRLIS